MPSIRVDENTKMTAGQRFNLNLKTMEIRRLKQRNQKRPTKYVGRRKRTAVVLTVANGRGQRRS